jgi:signal transduction histidine kinase
VPFHDVRDPDRLHGLLDAIMLIETDMDLTVLLRQVVVAASQLVGARYGALGVTAPSGTELSDFITCGLSAEQIERIGALPKGKGLLGELLHHPEPRRSTDVQHDPDAVGFPAGHPPMHTFLGVPVLSGDGLIFGNLYVTDRIDGEPFSDDDVALLEAFGRAASLIIDEARLREQLKDLTLTEERERLARDLHDTVIQRLFAVGLSLRTTLKLDMDDAVTHRISRAVDDLDATVKEIRAAIFEISHERPGSAKTLRTRVVGIVDEVTQRLGLPVDISFAGPVDTRIGPRCSDQVTRVLREILTNAVRHSGARHVAVHVSVDGDLLTLQVNDDGVGFDPRATSGRGLRNLTQRAEKLGGEFSVYAGDGGGTMVVWTAKELD